MRCLGFAVAGRPESLRVLAASSAPPASRLGPLQRHLTIHPWHMNATAATAAASNTTSASSAARTPTAPLPMRNTHVVRAASSSATPTTPSASSSLDQQQQVQQQAQQQQEEEGGIRFVYEPPRRFVLGALRQRRMGPPSLARPRVDLMVEGNPLGTLA